jgi:transposase-like protein
MERVSQQGFEILPELIQVIINAAMQAERQQYLKAEPYQHTEERQGHANGYKPKTVHTRVGNIAFAIPQVREGGFYPEALEKGLRSERALMLALAEMYVQGVSTRKVKVVTEKLCGVAMSSTQVSHAAALLDTELEKWRNRPLGEYPTCSWMPIMNRCVKTGRFAIWPFYQRWASIWTGNVRSWVFPWP